jgi:hypothetical protein
MFSPSFTFSLFFSFPFSFSFFLHPQNKDGKKKVKNKDVKKK